VPRRRCVGCGRVAPKPEFVRLVAAAREGGRSTRATIDRAGAMPGRGAYLCRAGGESAPNVECLRLATRNGGLQRALRRAVELPAELLDVGSLESEARVAQPDVSLASRAPRFHSS